MKQGKKDNFIFDNENDFSEFNTSQLLNKMNDTAAIMQRISLHLEVQPKDREALEILKICETKRIQAMKEYETRYVLRQKDIIKNDGND